MKGLGGETFGMRKWAWPNPKDSEHSREKGEKNFEFTSHSSRDISENIMIYVERVGMFTAIREKESESVSGASRNCMPLKIK